jgi:lysophospholipase L1-like esterase
MVLSGCALLLVVAALIAAFPTHGAASSIRGTASWHPSGIAAAGDSLSTGYGSVDLPGRKGLDHPEESWSIGSSPAVKSLYARIRERWPQVGGHRLLVAHDGATVSALAGQLQRVVARRDIDYVTIQIGSNDICNARRPSEITPVTTFRRRFARAFAILESGASGVRVLVTSVADEARWNDAVLQIPSMRSQLAPGTVCDPNPGPDGRQDPAARALIQGWEQAYDRALASVCAAFKNCRYDGGALYRLVYQPADVSRHDAYHPSVLGLARMAAATWRTALALASARG